MQRLLLNVSSESTGPSAPKLGDCCLGCAVLVTDYIDTGNRLVDLTLAKAPLSELGEAATLEARARRKLLRYQLDNCCRYHCQNRICCA
jgi:hypothetical protein